MQGLEGKSGGKGVAGFYSTFTLVSSSIWSLAEILFPGKL